MDPRGFPPTLPEFQRVFPDDGPVRYTLSLGHLTELAAFSGLPQQICVPLQPTFLPNDDIQLCPGSRGACLSTHLRDALQWGVDSPDGMIGNQPDRNSFK